MISRRFASAFLVGSLAFSGPAMSQQWAGVAIGNTAPDIPEAQAEALLASEGLQALGISVTKRLDSADAVGMATAIGQLAASRQAVLYFAGPTALGIDGEILLGTGGAAPLFAGQLSLDNIANRMAQGATRELVVILEDCSGRAADSPGALANLSYLPEPPLDMLLVSAAGPGGTCGQNVERLAATLGTASGPVTRLEDFEAAFASASILQLSPPAGAELPDTADSAPADFGPMTLALGAAAPDEVISAPSAGIGFDTTPPPGDDSASTDRAQVIRVGIRPSDPIIKERSASRRPSILIGILPEELQALTAPPEPEEPEEPVLPPAPAFDDRIARDTLRQSNPEAFAILLANGAMDPPDSGQIALALQSELKDMRCYNSVLDNDWGPGSKRGLEAYAEERKVAVASIAPDLEATVDLWREIISNDPVTCPQVVTAAPVKKNTTTKKATTTKAPTKKAAPVKKAPVQKKSSGSSIRKGLSGSGGFR